MNAMLLPVIATYYPNKELVLEDYIKVVREGIDGVMPSYVNSPKKGSRDITDSELRRQFKILKSLEKGMDKH